MKEGLAAVAEYEAEFGAFTDGERTWASGLLDSLALGTKPARVVREHTGEPVGASLGRQEPVAARP